MSHRTVLQLHRNSTHIYAQLATFSAPECTRFSKLQGERKKLNRNRCFFIKNPYLCKKFSKVHSLWL